MKRAVMIAVVVLLCGAPAWASGGAWWVTGDATLLDPIGGPTVPLGVVSGTFRLDLEPGVPQGGFLEVDLAAARIRTMGGVDAVAMGDGLTESAGTYGMGGTIDAFFIDGHLNSVEVSPPYRGPGLSFAGFPAVGTVAEPAWWALAGPGILWAWWLFRRR